MDNKSPNEFLNKKIIITGASSGIGSAVATYFLNSGAIVVLVGKDVESMKRISAKFPDHSTIITCDLTTDIEIYDLKSSAIERLGMIDILVNCAGIKFGGDVEKTFPQEFDYTVDVNLRSVFILIKSFEKFFSKNACVVNVSCLYGTHPMYGVTSYCMAKAGLEALTKCAAAEYAEMSLRINCVTACPVLSNSLRYIQAPEAELQVLKEKMAKNIPMGRIALPDDVAKAIVFLCSKRASSITGQVIKVDGGRSLTTSGYVHYKGIRNMNSRFEPDDVNILNKLDVFGLMKKREYKPEELMTMSDEEMNKYIEEKMNQSNFSTRLFDAHKRIETAYKKIDDNNSILYSKYSINSNFRSNENN